VCARERERERREGGRERERREGGREGERVAWREQEGEQVKERDNER
jgi:hypothetical protein